MRPGIAGGMTVEAYEDPNDRGAGRGSSNVIRPFAL